MICGKLTKKERVYEGMLYRGFNNFSSSHTMRF